MSACKRYPCLAPLGLIIAIRAMAKLPQLTESDTDAWLRGEDAGPGVYDKLQAEVLGSRGLPRLPAPTAQSAAGRLPFQNCSRFLKSGAGPVQPPELERASIHLE